MAVDSGRALAAFLALCALVPAGAVGVAGCGGADPQGDAPYADAVNAAQSDFRRRFDALSRGAGATSTPAQDRRMLARFDEAVDAAVARLRAAAPPARAAALHRRLIEQIGSYHARIAAARQALAVRDPQRVLAARAQFAAAVGGAGARVNRTVDAINAALRGG